MSFSKLPVFLPNGIERIMFVDRETMKARFFYNKTAGFPTLNSTAAYNINGTVVQAGTDENALIFVPEPDAYNIVKTIMLFLEKRKTRDAGTNKTNVYDYRNELKKNHRYTRPVAKACDRILQAMNKTVWFTPPDYTYASDDTAHYRFYRAYSQTGAELPKIERKPIIVKSRKPDMISMIAQKVEADIVIEKVTTDPIQLFGEDTVYLGKKFKMNYNQDNDNSGYVRLFGTMVQGRNIDGEFVTAA